MTNVHEKEIIRNQSFKIIYHQYETFDPNVDPERNEAPIS